MLNVSRAPLRVCLRLRSVSFVASVARTAVAAAAVLLAAATGASAQTTDVIGVRAQGMGGAFTAVADDATASWWNPAGLAGGPFFNGLIEYSRPEKSSSESVRGFALAYPALGLTYYRLPLSQIRLTTSTGVNPASRQEERALSVFAATVGQSFGEHLVLGTTVKLLHADDTTASIDAGAMASFGVARIGLTVHDLGAPELGSGVDAFTLERHVRAGGALSTGRRGVIGSATLSVDADLTTTHDPLFGDERAFAVGGEVWTAKRTAAVRGGFSRNTVGAATTQLSGGVSVAIRSGSFVDAYISGGSNAQRHGWGLSLRATF